MNTTQILQKYYTKESMVTITTSYLLYYQTSVAHLTYEMVQDRQKAANKLREMDLTLNPNTILASVFSELVDPQYDDSNSKNFDMLLQQTALKHSLNDFVQKYKLFPNKEIFIEQKLHKIKTETFFSSSMKMSFLREYAAMQAHYTQLITDQYAKDVQKILAQHFASHQ